MTSTIEPIQRVALYPGQLMADHSPELEDANKKLVFDIAHPHGSRLSGNIGFTRWEAMELPSNFGLSEVLETTEGRADIYDYQPVSDSHHATEWHVNFADPELFFGYGTGLFAQAEMQVAEHTVLGSLREYLKARGYPSATVEDRNPTPILVSGASRSCQTRKEVNVQLNRPHGLYGNQFSFASEETVRLATDKIEPPTKSNIISMAAPATGGPNTQLPKCLPHSPPPTRDLRLQCWSQHVFRGKIRQW
jgi:hypothetical protein